MVKFTRQTRLYCQECATACIYDTDHSYPTIFVFTIYGSALSKDETHTVQRGPKFLLYYMKITRCILVFIESEQENVKFIITLTT